MKPKTEELLYLLFWTCDMLRRPTFRNLTDSFEAWAYRNGFQRELADLERGGLIESQVRRRPGSRQSERALRLAEAGCLHVLGGREPEACWRRKWNGRWHLVLFDLPAADGTARNRLRNALRARGFGWLQNSVWVGPHPLPDQDALLRGTRADVESLLFMEARPSAGERDEEIVSGAWDFEEINSLYRHHLNVLSRCPRARLRDASTAAAFREWARSEREAWRRAVVADPLLPECLLPPGYLGQNSWRRRLETLRQAAALVRGFEAKDAADAEVRSK